MGAAPNIAPSPLGLAALHYADRGLAVFPLHQDDLTRLCDAINLYSPDNLLQDVYTLGC